MDKYIGEAAVSDIINSLAQGTRPQTISGLYQGEMILPQPGRFVLELRATSTAKHRLTGHEPGQRRSVPGHAHQPAGPALADRANLYRVLDHRPAGAERRRRPRRHHRQHSFWIGTHPATTAALSISWPGSPPAVSAKVTFTETGGSTRGCNCRRSSDSFRKVNFEIDVCASVNRPPLLPTYDTTWHDDRPADLPHRVLTVEESSYQEAGVHVTIDPDHSVVDDHAPQFDSWTPALLHDAMETYFSQYGGTWPNWQMWGLMAGLFETPGVGGVMFDAASQFGGAGKAPERQGFAVFRRHEWFNNLVPGTPKTRTRPGRPGFCLHLVHEAGHSFNFLHAWDKGRPDSLSWMNCDWRFDQRNGDGTFWKRFAFRFDDDELIHLRHGNRASVIMGGDPWSSGSHLETPNLAMTQIEGQAPLELMIRSKQYFDLMEPVVVELRLRNLLNFTPVAIDKRLAPEYGGVVVYIQNPDGHVVQYDPVMCAVGTPDMQMLAPAPANKQLEGPDRYSKEIFLSYGSSDFYFDQPGQYRIRAVYQGPGDVLIPSEAHSIRIGVPASKEVDRVAQDFFTDTVGLTLYLQGSRSPFLQKGTNVLEDIADRYKDTPLGAKVAVTLANGVSRPFYRVERANPDKPKLTRTSTADPQAALTMTNSALKVFRDDNDKSGNLAYSRIVQRRADYHNEMGDPKKANEELRDLATNLAERGANPSVVNRYRQMCGMPTSPEPSVPAQPAAQARKPARRGRKPARAKRPRKRG